MRSLGYNPSVEELQVIKNTFFDKRLNKANKFAIMAIPIMYYLILISGYDERVSLCYGRAEG